MKARVMSCAGAIAVLLLLADLQAGSRSRALEEHRSNPVVGEAPEARLVQVHPARKNAGQLSRSRDQKRAVVLIHGYWVHFRKENVHKALLRDWQEPDSLLVNTLSRESDIFAFSYGQTVPLDQIVVLPALRDGIAAIKKLGYTRIVLVGHSAGGLIARQFVEDNPKAGVTKVVQISAPNRGTTVAEFKWVPKCQRPFLTSLSTAGRVQCLAKRNGKKIPDAVHFVCLMTLEDALVPLQSQWSQDLQQQGIPVVRCPTGHSQIVRKAASAQKIAEVIREPQPRWSAERVALLAREISTLAKTK
jgi:pimeloyl-ACP methyl ester carboxylesterase